jgi:hypothetical protein
MEEVKDLRLDNRQGMGAKLQELMKRIPGFEGYLDREQRRKADSIHREYLTKLLSTKKRTIQDIASGLLESGDLSHMTSMDSLTNNIDRISNRIRSAGSAGGNFFAMVDVDTELLDRIYEYDLALLGEIESLDEKINTLQNACESNDNIKPAIAGVKSVLTALDGSLDGREKLLKGLE